MISPRVVVAEVYHALAVVDLRRRRHLEVQKMESKRAVNQSVHQTFSRKRALIIEVALVEVALIVADRSLEVDDRDGLLAGNDHHPAAPRLAALPAVD